MSSQVKVENEREILASDGQRPQVSTSPDGAVVSKDNMTSTSELLERSADQPDDSPAKRRKFERDEPPPSQPEDSSSDRVKGIAPIKQDFLINLPNGNQHAHVDDDEAEAAGKSDAPPVAGRGGPKTKGGQNHARQFGSSKDAIELCKSRSTVDELAPVECSYGKNCKNEHDIRKYLQQGKREDLSTFDGVCPVFKSTGNCVVGWRCRFASSHSKEIEREDGRKELVLVRKTDSKMDPTSQEEQASGVVNVLSPPDRTRLRKKQVPMPKSDKYIQWINAQINDDATAHKAEKNGGDKGDLEDRKAEYREAPLRPSEKRRIYYGPETPILAPLTTQGNLPFRRLCVSLGAQVTWSEMAMGLPLIQGERQEWALMKAHESELQPPIYRPKSLVHDYDNSKDFKFGAQIAAHKPWLALKATEALTTFCPRLRAIDLNCGCPIELVVRQGAGSALLDAHSKLDKILRGMNAVSGEIPITVKIRTGTKDKQPSAEKLCRRLTMGAEVGPQSHDGPAGVAAITLHGRSRQQRYSRSADWEYIASCASLVQDLRTERARGTDTIREPDDRDLSASGSPAGLPYFIGNGDILSHVDYHNHLRESRVDGCMIARGALIKPWIFEEIAAGQYLDKSATERLAYVEQFARHGLEYWGSDEIGVGTTRRFLLEWLSFACRYVPEGILEHLPPRFGDRPPAFRGRNELETLLSSSNYRDWIRIRWVLSPPATCDVCASVCADVAMAVRCSWVRHTRTSASSPSTSPIAMRWNRRGRQYSILYP